MVLLKATIKDVQRKTNLSLSTISKYINGGNVLEQNKIIIDSAIKELDFKVNQFARGLKTNKSETIGILIPEFNSTFNTSIIANMQDILLQSNYGVIVCDSRLDKDSERQAIDFLLRKKVDGIITIPYDRSGTHLKRVRAENIPVVLIDRLTTDFETDAVIINNEEASRIAINEIIRNGHRRIGIICVSDKIFTMKERMNGYKKALSENNIKYDDKLVAIEEMTITGGFEGFKKITNIPDPPTAIFLVNYEITLGAVIAMNEFGIKIGQDISVIGFDNIELARVIKPELTMVIQPMQGMSHCAARLMLKRLSGLETGEAKTVVFDAVLKKGESVINLN